MIGLQGRVPNTSADNWFQCWMVLFTKEYFPISGLCLLFLILPRNPDCLGAEEGGVWHTSVDGYLRLSEASVEESIVYLVHIVGHFADHLAW